MRYSVSTTNTDEGVFDPQVGCWWMKQTMTAFNGYCQVRADADEFFGGEESEPFQSKVLCNPSWRTLFNLARKQQRATKDFHHDFFEGYYLTKQTETINGEPVHIIRLALGS